MPRFGVYEIPVTLVDTVSLTSRECHGVLKIGDKSRPNINEFLNQVKTICNEIITPRIYWRVSESRFMNIKNYIDLKCALNLISSPRIYALSEASAFIIREENIHGVIKTGTDFSTVKNHPSNRETFISDVEILRCVTSEELPPDPSNRINYYSADETNETIIHTREYDEVYRKLKILNKALSLLCVRPTSGSAMLEAPPGSREDLVEAARIPCTQPTDLDAMLYGYTNSIYVLDHAQESLPDMDMLQLFASPAGRALVVNETQPKGTTLTSSMSRESSSRSKNIRRTSSGTGTGTGTGTASAPASPPRQRKSSAELYKEAAEILGLTCSMTDSCRCIDCQSNYFDCEEDYGDTRTEVAAGTPILHALSHPLTCTIQ